MSSNKNKKARPAVVKPVAENEELTVAEVSETAEVASDIFEAEVAEDSDDSSMAPIARTTKNMCVNLRQTPHADSDVLMLLPPSSEVYEIGVEGEYTHVYTITGQTGYVLTSLLV